MNRTPLEIVRSHVLPIGENIDYSRGWEACRASIERELLALDAAPPVSDPELRDVEANPPDAVWSVTDRQYGWTAAFQAIRRAALRGAAAPQSDSLDVDGKCHNETHIALDDLRDAVKAYLAARDDQRAGFDALREASRGE
jgi:hypothetical protein